MDKKILLLPSLVGRIPKKAGTDSILQGARDGDAVIAVHSSKRYA